MEHSDRLERVMDFIDESGAPPVEKKEWRDLLKDIISECDMRLEAVESELAEEV